jgi:hypothetical protein
VALNSALATANNSASPEEAGAIFVKGPEIRAESRPSALIQAAHPAARDVGKKLASALFVTVAIGTSHRPLEITESPRIAFRVQNILSWAPGSNQTRSGSFGLSHVRRP